MKFATGKNAWFMCGKCGLRGRYAESVADGQTPGLRVHPTCRDIKHPQERPFNAEDGEALQHPTGDIDRPSDALATVATLADELPAMDGGASYFGGST